MLPEYQRLSQKSAFQIPFGTFALRVVSLPFCSFIFCVVWSVISDFERATATHCHVYNFLPSISAAIGNYQPQRLVWQGAIIAHSLPRFMVAWVYHQKYKSVIRKGYRPLAKFATFLNVIENVALIGLSVFTSVDNYGGWRDNSCCNNKTIGIFFQKSTNPALLPLS